MKIIAVGMNYPLHCKELHAEEPLPEEPVIFMKPDSALLKARDLQRRFRSEGKPWELCKGFDNSAAIGDWIPVGQFANIQNIRFHLDIDGQKVQEGNTCDMIFPVDRIIAYVSQFCTLKIGDLLYTGTPVGVGPVAIGNHLEGYVEDRKVLDFNIR